MSLNIAVVGGGLAGVECAMCLHRFGFSVTLFEMKPKVMSKAHKSELFAELVCSNSFKSLEFHTAPGILKEEMKVLGSVILGCAERAKIPGGKALVVNRDEFSRVVTETVESAGLRVIRQPVGSIEELSNFDFKVICTGPLTWKPLELELQKFFGSDWLSFFDAVSPIIDGSSIDFSQGFWGGRYSDQNDYFNIPLTREQYYEFVEMMLKAEKFEPVLDEEKDYKTFNGCQPIEDIAAKGVESLRFGQFSPKGLSKDAYAVIQLRKEDLAGNAFSLVGFQTRLKHPEQKKLLQSLPALKNCEILRYGVMHRNTYLKSPQLLNKDLSAKKYPTLFFAGQITGVEGYLESAASGLYVAYQIAARVSGFEDPFPENSILGGLIKYVTGYTGRDFQPMNANFSLVDCAKMLEAKKVKDKRQQRLILRDVCVQNIQSWKNSFEKHFSEFLELSGRQSDLRA